MTALATLDDLKSNGIEVIDEQTATSLLDSVSDAVRSAAGCPITIGEWTVDIPGEQSRKLDLPCKAVRSVSKVLIDGKTVDAGGSSDPHSTAKSRGAPSDASRRS